VIRRASTALLMMSSRECSDPRAEAVRTMSYSSPQCGPGNVASRADVEDGPAPLEWARWGSSFASLGSGRGRDVERERVRDARFLGSRSPSIEANTPGSICGCDGAARSVGRTTP